MVEQDWTRSTIMSGHLQKLVKQGFLMAAELVACHVPEDPAFPAPEEGNMVSVPRSFDILDLGAAELRLLGYPRVPLLLASWRQVAGGGVELMCLRVATMCRLLKEMLAVVSRDVLQPARVSPKMKQEVFLPNFARPSISLLTPSLF
jgi:hypothetical protein